MRHIEFIVGPLRYEGERLFVAGRCAKDTLCVGDIFSCIYDYEPAKTLEDYAVPAIKRNIWPVSLLVKSIRAYGRALEELSSGMTAQVELSGSGTENLVLDRVLSGDMK